jgi:hypothetical protein
MKWKASILLLIIFLINFCTISSEKIKKVFLKKFDSEGTTKAQETKSQVCIVEECSEKVPGKIYSNISKNNQAATYHNTYPLSFL